MHAFEVFSDGDAHLISTLWAGSSSSFLPVLGTTILSWPCSSLASTWLGSTLSGSCRAGMGSAMPLQPAVPTATASQVECCRQVLPGAAMCQGDLLQMGREDQSSNEKCIRCPVCLHEDRYPLQVNLELHPQQCPLHTQRSPRHHCVVQAHGALCSLSFIPESSELRASLPKCAGQCEGASSCRQCNAQLG